MPQASIGFSPLEMLYEGALRAPITILKDLWSREELGNVETTTYTYVLELKNQSEATCKLAHEKFAQARQIPKKYYDRKAAHRKLQPGDKMLVLLPTDNKMLMQWKGPFTVTQRKNELDNEISVQDHKNRLGQHAEKHVGIHQPFLKKSQERKEIEKGKNKERTRACMVIAQQNDHGEVHNYIDKKNMGVESVRFNQSLAAPQVEALRGLIHKFEEVFSDVPGGQK